MWDLERLHAKELTRVKLVDWNDPLWAERN